MALAKWTTTANDEATTNTIANHYGGRGRILFVSFCKHKNNFINKLEHV